MSKIKFSKKIEQIPLKVFNILENSKIPQVKFRSRIMKNIVKNQATNIWELGEIKTKKSAKNVPGSISLIRYIELSNLLKNLYNKNKTVTLREVYYISENWKVGKFNTQPESDKAIEELEVYSECIREEFCVRAEPRGTIAGPILIREKLRNMDGTTAKYRKIHCQKDVGRLGYTLPSMIQDFEILECSANFVLAVETAGMYARLLEDNFDVKYNCVLVSLRGQPSRMAKLVIKQLAQKHGLKVAVFTDCDPWSHRILAALKYGSIKTSHLSNKLATPGVIYIGVLPTDITKYKLRGEPLKKSDKLALSEILKDPRFNSDFWREQIQHLLDLGVKSEQQALLKYGFKYVSTVYLPEKLKQHGIIKTTSES